jgi:hypothetical protein
MGVQIDSDLEVVYKSIKETPTTEIKITTINVQLTHNTIQTISNLLSQIPRFSLPKTGVPSRNSTISTLIPLIFPN